MELAAYSSRVAHLSDVHMLATSTVTETRRRSRESYDLSTRFVSIGRELNGHDRVQKLSRGLAAVARSGAGHVVISGDLTELGSKAEIETFASVLHTSKIAPDRIVLVPGNHDVYTSADAWLRALDGPLRPFRSGAADAPGKVVERDGVTFLPIDVTRYQPITRSAGELTDATADALERRLRDPYLRRGAVVIVQHHPPFSHDSRAWQWLDGLRGWARMMDLLNRFPNVQVLHGHLHHVVDKIVGIGRARIFGAPATVDDKRETARVRIYDVRDGMLESQGILEG